MAKSPFAKRDEERDVTRRALIQWSVAAGAALGVSRAKIIQILENTAGKETAFAAAANPSTKSVHIIGGNGGMSWATLLFPQVDVVDANDPNLSFQAPGTGVNIAGTDRPLRAGRDTPWQNLAPAKQITGFVAGSAQAHTDNPQQSLTNLNNNNIFAVATALQSANPSVVPVIALSVNNQALQLGTAPGAATATAVNKGTDIVGLFNSAASRAGGLLSKSQDATAYAVQYAAFAQLNKASARSTQKTSYTTAIGAAGLLGTNLSAKLAIQASDLTRYGITGNTQNNIKDIANTLIVSVKAFKMGLTQCVLMPFMNDDPHGAFADGRANTVPPQLKTVFDAFMADLTTTTDDVTNQVLADDIVITFSGDTPKDTLSHAGGNWGDGTPGGTNFLVAYTSGHLKSGWFGGIQRNGTINGFDGNGNAAAYNAANTGKLALASVAYAIAKRDDRAAGMFANGIPVSGIFGRAKDT